MQQPYMHLHIHLSLQMPIRLNSSTQVSFQMFLLYLWLFCTHLLYLCCIRITEQWISSKPVSFPISEILTPSISARIALKKHLDSDAVLTWFSGKYWWQVNSWTR